MAAQDVVVAAVRRDAERRPGHLVEPLTEERPELVALARDGAVLVARLEQRRELRDGVGPRLADHEASEALPVLVADVDGALPAAVLAEVD